MSSEQAFEQIASSIPADLEQLDGQIKEIKKMMADVKDKWFQALDKQQYAVTLNDKITKKLDKVNEVQRVLGVLIDDITNEIEQKDVDDVLGESACMFIQQHIVTANALVDKVDKIKDQMDKGELDGRSNIASMLNSVADNDLNHSFENSNQESKKSPNAPSRLKKTVRTETNIQSLNQSIRNQKFQDQFQIQSAAGSDDEAQDDEDKEKPADDLENAKQSVQLNNSVIEDMKTSLVEQVAQGSNGDKNLKYQENQLLKYNNIYDKLRKKRDLLENLLG